MLDNKRADMTPFPMNRRPVKQYPFLLPLIWGVSYLATRKFDLKITKSKMEGLKPPYLVISTHQGFSDYYIAPLAVYPHRANYVSDMEGFAAFGDWLYRGVGCIGKRRFVSDYSVVRNIKYALSKKQIVVVFPESRHSNVGTTSYIPQNIGKLAKLMQVPVVTLSIHGSYLANPFWDEEHTRRTKMEATLECIYTTEQLAKAEESDVQKVIEEKLTYDEYHWQKQQKIQITEPERAKGLHFPLYQCYHCKEQGVMDSSGVELFCKCCGAHWELTPDGMLIQKGNREIPLSIPDWYEWERRETIHQLEQQSINETYNVTVEALPNAKGFVSLGDGILNVNETCFSLKIGDRVIDFPHKSRESVQTEYQYRKII